MYPRKESIAIMIGYCGHCMGPGMHLADQHQLQKRSTLSIDGYQRFERAMVGLDAGVLEAGQEESRIVHQRRKKR